MKFFHRNPDPEPVETPEEAPAPKTALVPLADGFEDLEAIAAIDILRRGGVTVTTASLNATRAVTSAHGIAMEADALLADVLENAWDAIILPGGGKGTENLAACAPLVERLHEERERIDDGLSETYLCAICAAPTVLDKAGVIRGEQVTCYPTCAEDMQCPVVDMPVIADGPLITGQGPGAAVLFGLAVLEHLMSPEAADAIAHGMVMPA